MKKENRIFAFVFARGGSKGLINKNLLPIGGIPLVGRSIKIAKKLEIIEKNCGNQLENQELKRKVLKFLHRYMYQHPTEDLKQK